MVVLKQASELRPGDRLMADNGTLWRIERINRADSKNVENPRYVGKVIANGITKTVIAFDGGEPIETWSDEECAQPTP